MSLPVNFTITQPASALTASAAVSSNSSCSLPNGSFTVTATGGTPIYLYALNGGTASAVNIYTGMSAGSDQVVVTDMNGCSVTVSVAVTGVPSLSLAASSYTNVLCYGQSNGSASVIVTGGTPSYSLPGVMEETPMLSQVSPLIPIRYW